jgi:hypothetical protein
VLRAADVDVGQARERRRQRRLVRLAVVLWVTALAVWWRILTGGLLNPLARIHLGPDTMLWPPAVLIVVLIAVVMLLPMVGQGRSPHLTGAARPPPAPGRGAQGRPLAREELSGPEILEVLREAEAGLAVPLPARGGPAGRRRPARWPIRAGPGRFTPEVS